jgi:hypothetical protein
MIYRIDLAKIYGTRPSAGSGAQVRSSFSTAAHAGRASHPVGLENPEAGLSCGGADRRIVVDKHGDQPRLRQAVPVEPFDRARRTIVTGLRGRAGSAPALPPRPRSTASCRDDLNCGRCSLGYLDVGRFLPRPWSTVSGSQRRHNERIGSCSWFSSACAHGCSTAVRRTHAVPASSAPTLCCLVRPRRRTPDCVARGVTLTPVPGSAEAKGAAMAAACDAGRIGSSA